MRKFIIEDGYIKLGDVEMHKYLAFDKTKVISGGFWSNQFEPERILFFWGKSADFGRVTEEQLIEARINSMKEEDSYSKFKWFLVNCKFSMPDFDDIKSIETPEEKIKPNNNLLKK